MILVSLLLISFSLIVTSVLKNTGDTWYSRAGVLGLVFMVPCLYISYLETLSKPKVFTQEFYRTEYANVAAFVIKPGESLYILYELDGKKDPRYYKYPWSDKVSKLAEGLQGAQERGEKARVQFPFEPSLEKDEALVPSPIPQLADPPKQPTRTGNIYNET